MYRRTIEPRSDWQQKVEELGFGFHSYDECYWDESAYYEFSSWQIDVLEKASAELFDRCLDAVQHVIDHKLYPQFGIDPRFIPFIESSWDKDAPSIYARFDLAYDGVNPPKMLEFNADTPTTLFEAGVVQWHWMNECYAGHDQFNSIHEKLIDYWKILKPYLKKGTLYFAPLKDNLEDLTTVEYLRDCAIQAGLDTDLIFIEDIGWADNLKRFVDLYDQPIDSIFKLYPWEWLCQEDFAQNLLVSGEQTCWIEPPWKMILSNKAILPILWKLFPNHPNLLPSFFEKSALADGFVRKPKLSREGQNVMIQKGGRVLDITDGDYDSEEVIYQQFFEIPSFDGHYPVLGSWIIGCEPAGIGIRESQNLITDNYSHFIPHVIV